LVWVIDGVIVEAHDLARALAQRRQPLYGAFSARRLATCNPRLTATPPHAKEVLDSRDR
jgi:hypothetical protein